VGEGKKERVVGVMIERRKEGRASDGMLACREGAEMAAAAAERMRRGVAHVW
jgi:hypothetical protein